MAIYCRHLLYAMIQVLRVMIVGLRYALKVAAAMKILRGDNVAPHVEIFQVMLWYQELEVIRAALQYAHAPRMLHIY
jgi:hypothetical protein